MAINDGSIYNDDVRNAGEIAEHLPDEYITTHTAQEEISFGYAVARGSSADAIKVISSASDELLGVAAQSFEASLLNDMKYAAGDAAGVVRKGIVVVYVEEEVSPGNSVRVRHTAQTGKPNGAFCTTAVAGKTAIVKNAEFKGSTAGPGYVALWVDGPFTLIADEE
jgi:hypothetical protein